MRCVKERVGEDEVCVKERVGEDEVCKGEGWGG